MTYEVTIVPKDRNNIPVYTVAKMEDIDIPGESYDFIMITEVNGVKHLINKAETLKISIKPSEVKKEYPEEEVTKKFLFEDEDFETLYGK